MNRYLHKLCWQLTVLLCILGAAGCADAAAGQPDDAEPSAGVSPEVERQIIECLAEAGFDPTPPQVDEDGRFTQALEQCVTRLGVRDQFFREPDPQEQEQERIRHNERMLAYVACMRERGWQVPDPVADADGFLLDQEPVGLDGAQRTAFANDLRECGESTLGETLEGSNASGTDDAATSGMDDGATHDHGAHDHGDDG
jgi:hypothetical protein